jgi:hypothetical protein
MLITHISTPTATNIPTSNSTRVEIIWRWWQATPGADNGATVLGLVADTKFNYDRGFYQTAFSLEITANTTDANIY